MNSFGALATGRYLLTRHLGIWAGLSGSVTTTAPKLSARYEQMSRYQENRPSYRSFRQVWRIMHFEYWDFFAYMVWRILYFE